MDEGNKKLSSNGNVVNVGDFDGDGVNVNDDNPRNRNDNLGFRFSRSVTKLVLVGGFCICLLDPTTKYFANLQQLLFK